MLRVAKMTQTMKKRGRSLATENPPKEEQPTEEKLGALTDSDGDVSGEEGCPEHDPYLLKNAPYIKKSDKWKNKQRTLVFSSRGIGNRSRHLMNDLKRLMPHHKSEVKWEKKQSFDEIPDICEMASCNNCVFFEARRGSELYMWVSRVPHGPTFKCQILNIHTLGELKLTGNCLLHSRPLLSFDSSFDDVPHYSIIRELLTHAFGTPRNHPLSKPFFDHVYHFAVLDGKIWFRHYQISPDTLEDANDPSKTILTEIGPRFVIDPMRVFSGAFGGKTLWKNEEYITPMKFRQQARQADAKRYIDRVESEKKKQKYTEQNKMKKDELSIQEVFGDALMLSEDEG
eukprot:GHVO01054526.1.p1 GENE.GHVO01054526.1~~GHVO01054526.1.p1  ORF type:complete len:342 (+),score=69.32 GHVO01054526.1:203-1228(+)